jgi:hypothetical protein
MRGVVSLKKSKISGMNAPKSISPPTARFAFSSPPVMLIMLGFIVVASLLGPSDRILGSNLRLILLHGAWVWTGMILFALSAAVGLAGLFIRRKIMHSGSLALGRAGLAFWLTYLPMSLLVMQMNWGGLYFDEPRWRIPFSFAVIAVLLQIGLVLINHPLVASSANVLFGVALWYNLRTASTVLHPEAPLTQSDFGIQLYFFLLLALALMLGLQSAHFLYRRENQA